MLGIAEGDAGARHLIDPGLERCGHAEIVDRQADHQRVGSPQFGDERVRQGKGGALVIGAVMGGG